MGIRPDKGSAAKLAKAYVINLLGLDPKTLSMTEDSAWITIAKRLKARAPSLRLKVATNK